MQRTFGLEMGRLTHGMESMSVCGSRSMSIFEKIVGKPSDQAGE